MKKKLLILLAAAGISLTAFAEGNVRTIRSPRFARPLIEKWIEEYAKAEPSVEFRIARGAAAQNEVDLNVALGTGNVSTRDYGQLVYFGETAVLPITAQDSEAARLLEGKHLSARKLKRLFFFDEDDEEGDTSLGKLESITVYSGNSSGSVAASFADNLGADVSDFRGKRISGDDLFLNTALVKDPLGVSFNALSNIYDLSSRHLKKGISAIGTNVKEELDDEIASLERDKPSEVAILKVGFAYDATDEAVTRFLQWVLEKGTQYNHQYGLLNLEGVLAYTVNNKQ